MELEYIKEFIILADTLNYSTAAQYLHISQPSLSRHIVMLEKELDEVLFERSTRRIVLSEFGRYWLPYAKQLAEDAFHSEMAIKEFKERKHNAIVIGCSHNAHLYFQTESILAFRRLHPEISVHMAEDSITNLRKSFFDGSLRLVNMAFEKNEIPKNGFIPAGTTSLVVLIPKEHFLASYKIVPLYRLQNVGLMVPSRHSIFYQILENAMHRENIHPNIIYSGGTTGSLSLLKEGLGVMVEDETIVSNLDTTGFVVRNITPTIDLTFGLQYAEHLNENERLFVNFIRERFKQK